MSEWKLTDHACRRCLGRVLMRETPSGKEVRCAECGFSSHGEPEDICCCGITLEDGVRPYECVKNDCVTEALPQEVIVREKTELISSKQ